MWSHSIDEQYIVYTDNYVFVSILAWCWPTYVELVAKTNQIYNNWAYYYYYYLLLCSPARAMASSLTRFRDHTQWRATVGRIPLDAWSVRRRDLYLTTHTTNIHASGGIRIHDRNRRAAVDLRLRLRGHWDRQLCLTKYTLLPVTTMTAVNSCPYIASLHLLSGFSEK
jgi:hypothetical protein